MISLKLKKKHKEIIKSHREIYDFLRLYAIIQNKIVERKINGNAQEEEMRNKEVMTDKQYDGILQMIGMI